MAVKLSSYYSFRNNYLVKSIEDPDSGAYWFGYKEMTPEERATMDSRPGLTPNDKKTLNFIIEELDGLKEKSYFCNGHIDHEENFRHNVIIMNLVELKDVTSDKELAAAYLEGIHKIMEQYWVKIDMYTQLGRCFEELGVEPSPDAAEAIKYAHDKILSNKYASQDSMIWQSIRVWEKEKAELKKNDPFEYWRRYVRDR